MYTVHFRLLARSFTAIVPYFPTGTMEREEVEGRVATAKVHWGGGHTLKKCSYLTAIYCVLPQCLLLPSETDSVTHFRVKAACQ